ASWAMSGGIASVTRRASAPRPAEPSRSCSWATVLPPTPRPPSVGERQADGPDGHESITARVDPLEVAVEHQELHPAIGGPAPEFCGNELEGHGDERPPREVSDRLILTVDRVVVLGAQSEGHGQADGQGV